MFTRNIKTVRELKGLIKAFKTLTGYAPIVRIKPYSVDCLEQPFPSQGFADSNHGYLLDNITPQGIVNIFNSQNKSFSSFLSVDGVDYYKITLN